MRLRLLPIKFIDFSLFNLLLGDHPSYITVPDGIIDFTYPQVTAVSNIVKPQAVANNTISATAAAAKELARAQSRVTVYAKRTLLFWNFLPSEGNPTLKTKDLTTIADLKTAAASFRNRSGNIMPGEEPPAGRNFQSAIFKKKRFFKLAGAFQNNAGEAGYDHWHLFGAFVLVFRSH